MSPTSAQHIECHYTASALAAIVNFPLWKASAIGQSGFQLNNKTFIGRYLEAMKPPYKGVAATMGGMTWARATIFYFSDVGRIKCRELGYSEFVSTALPPFVISTIVQVINNPIIRATITIQNPKNEHNNVRKALRHIYSKYGIQGLWHGVSAGILKTVPKYMTAVVVKDYVDDYLARNDNDHIQLDRSEVLERSAIKSIAAGFCGAVLTNPMDVIRNEMFKTHLSLTKVCQNLIREEGYKFLYRGMDKNVIAVTVPIALTIFLTDLLVVGKTNYYSSKNEEKGI